MEGSNQGGCKVRVWGAATGGTAAAYLMHATRRAFPHISKAAREIIVAQLHRRRKRDYVAAYRAYKVELMHWKSRFKVGVGECAGVGVHVGSQCCRGWGVDRRFDVWMRHARL